MYEDFYRLQERPFTPVPDPDYVFPGPRRRRLTRPETFTPAQEMVAKLLERPKRLVNCGGQGWPTQLKIQTP
jgi:hypothetical protein